MEIMVGTAMVATAFGTGVFQINVFVFICRNSSFYICCILYSHILAPSAVACDMFLLRASAHHWHVSAFLCNRGFQGISYYIKIQALLPAV